MKWLVDFLKSSIGQKLTMSLTGLFLCSFLVVHLIGNFQLLYADAGYSFNEYAYIMTNHPAVKTISWGLYAMILYHAIWGVRISLTNQNARGRRGYSRMPKGTMSWTSKNMAVLGSFVFIFLVIHMKDFWFQMKFGSVPYIDGSQEVKDLYTIVKAAFSELWYVILYVISMFFLGLHLKHGFQSGFQTLGLNHNKYTPLIKGLGLAFAILIPLGFAVIPVWMYLAQQP